MQRVALDRHRTLCSVGAMRASAVWSVAALLLLALALRLTFVLGLPRLPLYWDEPLYQARAQLIVAGVAGWASGGEGPDLARVLRPNLQKGELYSAMVAVIYATAGANPRAVFVVQALLDTLLCLLIYGLARAVAGHRAGIVALLAAALYEPFIFATARLQTETLSMLLCTASLVAICAPERRRVAGHAAAGLLVAAAMLCRPATQFLFPVLLPAVLLRNWDRVWPQRLLLVAVFATGFFAVVVPRLMLTKAVMGTALWSSTLDPSYDIYAGVVPRNLGWKTDRGSFAVPPSGELLAVVGTDPARRAQSADYRAATRRTVLWHPLESAGVMLHKLYVAWSYVYNDSRHRFLSAGGVTEIVHSTLLLLGLLGMPLALRRRVGVPLVATALYLWLSYVGNKIEVRYAILPMPLMICCAGIAAAELSRGWRRAWRAGARRRFARFAGGAVIFGAAALLDVGALMRVLPIGPQAAFALQTALILIALGWLAFTLADLAYPGRRANGLLKMAPAFLLGALVVLVGRPLAGTWREWRATLRPGQGVARQQFELPAQLGTPRRAHIKIDMLPDPDGGEVVVRFNGQELKRFAGGVSPDDENQYPEVHAGQVKPHEPDPAWYTIPVPIEGLTDAALVDVAVEGSGSLRLAGDYGADPSSYAGPSLFSPAARVDTSLFKYLADHDFRLRRRIALAAPSRSRWHDGDAWSEGDLAADAGRQQGRYRIFLLLTYDHGTVVL
jgi:hypothetical protein